MTKSTSRWWQKGYFDGVMECNGCCEVEAIDNLKVELEERLETVQYYILNVPQRLFQRGNSNTKYASFITILEEQKQQNMLSREIGTVDTIEVQWV